MTKKEIINEFSWIYESLDEEGLCDRSKG